MAERAERMTEEQLQAIAKRHEDYDLQYMQIRSLIVEVHRARESERELVDALQEAIRWADESENDPCEICGVSRERCGCWLGMARIALAKWDVKEGDRG